MLVTEIVRPSFPLNLMHRKTTTMHTISGLLEPYSGSIYLDDTEISKMKDSLKNIVQQSSTLDTRVGTVETRSAETTDKIEKLQGTLS